jgi:GntR family transcriptional regulator/MocR family aminotransferase
MPRTATPVQFELFSIERRRDTPYYQQIYEEIRQAVLTGRLTPGTALPSTRELAKQLGVGRGSVVIAYELLFIEGYVEGKTGSGTYVANDLPEDLLQPRHQPPVPDAPASATFSRRGVLMTAESAERFGSGPYPRPFEAGFGALDAFPRGVWAKIHNWRYRSMNDDLLVTGNLAGYPPLREAIAAYLVAARSVACRPEQVFIVPGVQVALDLLAHVLLEPGEAVWVEDPGQPNAYDAFTGAGLAQVAVPVDEEGLDVAAGLSLRPTARMVYITPSYQLPLGVTMSLPRRLALLDWAARSGAWIIEDDHDGEFRYAGRPLPALEGLDRQGRTIYLGTFTKVLYPNLRIGYVIMPEQLVELFSRVRALSDLQPATIDQAVLADFITEGHLARHVRRMRKLYAERQAVLLEAARVELTGLLDLVPRDSGIHLIGWLPDGADELAVVQAAVEHGVEVEPLSAYRHEPRPGDRPGLLLGFAAYDNEAIRRAVRRLAEALKTVLDRSVTGDG